MDYLNDDAKVVRWLYNRKNKIEIDVQGGHT